MDKNAAGTFFDPDLIKAFEKVEHKLKELFDSQYDPRLAESIIKRND